MLVKLKDVNTKMALDFNLKDYCVPSLFKDEGESNETYVES